MEKKSKLEEELEKYGVFDSSNIPKILVDLSNEIPNTISYDFRLFMSLAHLVSYVSTFKRKILFNNLFYTINIFSTGFMRSGSGKDTSNNILNKIFEPYYDKVRKEIKDIFIEEAINKAKEDGKAMATSSKVYSRYMSAFPDLTASISTSEGLVRNLNILDNLSVGSITLYSSEFSNELSTNRDIDNFLTACSELFDTGEKSVKLLKDINNQGKPIRNMPLNLILLSSYDQLLGDLSLKEKFKLRLKSQLARRGFIYYPNEKERINEDTKFNTNNCSSDYNIQYFGGDGVSKEVYGTILQKVYSTRKSAPLQLDKEALEIYLKYFQYCNEKASKINSIINGISYLHIKNAFSRALKISGAFAIIDDKDFIDKENLIQAIAITEHFSKRVGYMEEDFKKDGKDLLHHYVLEEFNKSNSKVVVAPKDLKTLGALETLNSIDSSLKNLCKLMNASFKDVVYSTKNSVLEAIVLKKNEDKNFKCSVLKRDYSKEDSFTKCNSGFVSLKCSFKDLSRVLCNNTAFTPVTFKDGIRSNDNIVGEISWIVLDKDKGELTDENVHNILKNINHHIARTSDPTNPNKFRIIIEISSPIDTTKIDYSNFIRSIADYIGVEVDVLPRSQAYYGYKDREVLSVVDKSPLDVRLHLLNSTSTKTILNIYTDKEKKELIRNYRDTFSYAFDAADGEGSISLYKAYRHAKDLGMTAEEIINLILEINSYWVSPMDSYRLEATILNQIRKDMK